MTRFIFIFLIFALNSCWFINHYDKESAIESITLLFSENKSGIDIIYKELVSIQLQDCERYIVGTGRGIDFFKIDKIDRPSTRLGLVLASQRAHTRFGTTRCEPVARVQ